MATTVSAQAFDTFLFDLDGTLIDSVADLATAVNLLRAELELSPLPVTQVREFVGDGATMLAKRSLPEGAFSEARLQHFLTLYGDHLREKTVVYPGIPEFLERHRGKKMAVVTNKPYRFAMELLEGFGLLSYFGVVLGGESCETKKPDPAPVRQALAVLGSDPATAVFIGDHHTDLRAGRGAGVATCFCAYGIGDAAGVPFDYRADAPADLLRLFPAEAR
jgi:phosphoglycolate phosphatase